MFSLTDKSILVTGATGGLGKACCTAIKAHQGQVFATGRREDRLSEMGYSGISADLTTGEGRKRLMEAAPACDGVVFAHGVSALSPTPYLKADSVDALLQANVTSCLVTLGLLLKSKRLRQGASVVFMASVAGQVGTAANAAYAASKGALISATRSLAVELARQSIRVNAICPGWIETGLTGKLGESLTDVAARREAERYPLGLGKPEDVAASVCFLLSDGARWITGTSLTVDGGFSCQ